jgi:predicted RNase H-like nuclease
MRVAGVDGCKAGWVVVSGALDFTDVRLSLVEDLRSVINVPRAPSIFAIDMPIGFLALAQEGGRACEKTLRGILVGKTSSVFSAPCRAALAARNYAEACELNKRHSSAEPVSLSQQSYGLFKKMREVDALFDDDRDVRIFECHPEFSFALMADVSHPRPILESKKSIGGLTRRAARLRKVGIEPARNWRSLFPVSKAQPDDILDAFACYWSATRIAAKTHRRLPESPEEDALGRLMAIHG